MNTPELPTPWQKQAIWSALSALSVVAIGAVAVGTLWLISRVLGFLQPFLIPFAVAGVLAYLLDPVVSRIVGWGTSRQRAVMAVFAVMTIALAGILVWIIPAIWTQTGNVVRKVPTYRTRVVELVESFNEWAHATEQKYGIRFLPQIPEKIEIPIAEQDAPAMPAAPREKAVPLPPAETAPAVPAAPPATTSEPKPPATLDLQAFLAGDWLRKTFPVVLRNVWSFITNSVGGFLGAFGFLLSMVIVPIYLYYFLIESKNIAQSWGDYLPLRASAFKDEVVAAISEINGYLIAFFRGQLLVSLINGTVTGIGLVIVGLDFGMLIGLLLCVLGVIPYLGIVICWVPAVIIASVQGGSYLIPAQPWWLFPLVVTAIFIVWQQIDGLFITPKIVGESVGLHPMTVIVSVFMWSLLMGGLLGAILAVPMTATLKVLLRRYVWQRKLRADAELAIVTEDSLPVLEAQAASGVKAGAVK
jgi:predicted PurR-regulated permease PerM